MTGSIQIGEQQADGTPYPDETTWTFDLGDGVRAEVTIRGEKILPRHLNGLRRLLDRVAWLLCDHVEITTPEEERP